jgi:hypothetical protein
VIHKTNRRLSVVGITDGDALLFRKIELSIKSKFKFLICEA